MCVSPLSPLFPPGPSSTVGRHDVSVASYTPAASTACCVLANALHTVLSFTTGQLALATGSSPSS